MAERSGKRMAVGDISLPRVEAYSGVAVRAAAWAVILAIAFALAYGAANAFTAGRAGVHAYVFGWEQAIPFVPWSVVPYLSVLPLCAAALFANESRSELDRLVGRLATALILAVLCFLLFPLKAPFVRPETFGLPHLLFGVLDYLDRPFNQAPSLHIAVLVIIWDQLRQRVGGWRRIAWNVWCGFAALSTLTTLQDAFIDLPTGAYLGLFSIWMFPVTGDLPITQIWPLSRWKSGTWKARRIGGYYGIGTKGGSVALGFGLLISPFFLLILWPGFACGIVSFGYLIAGPSVFQKRADGRFSLAARWLLLPYRIGARIHQIVRTRGYPANVPVADNVYLGRHPTLGEAKRFATVIDLAAEFERPKRAKARWVPIPLMDLLPPSEAKLAQAVQAIERCRADGPVLVCCALGFRRSAAAVCAWLVATGRARDFDEAVSMLRATGRPSTPDMPEAALAATSASVR